MTKRSLTIRFDDEVREMAKKAAEAEHRSMTSILEIAVREYVARHSSVCSEKSE